MKIWKDVHTMATKVATCGRELPFGLCQALLRSDTQSITLNNCGSAQTAATLFHLQLLEPLFGRYHMN